MMKKSKKLLAFVLSMAMVAPMAACWGTPAEESVPDDRVEIKISLYSGGYGTLWMDNLIARLNNSQETYWYTRNPDNKAAAAEITEKILGGIVEADMFFTTPADVERLVVGGYLEDLTEVYDYKHDGESLTIREKTIEYENYEKYLSDENGIYVMPNQYSVSGLVYDHDLFEMMGWLRTDSSTASGLTKGADGKEGTYDDGLPETYEQFKALVDQIAVEQVTPFIFGDKIGFAQMQFAIDAVWAQYDGYENYLTSMTYNGTYTSPSTGKQTTITPETGYKVYSENLQEGRWKAVQYLNEMCMNTSYMYNDQQGLSHTDAQAVYITSHGTQKPIAMLFDGGWWENEAKRAFAEDAKNTSEDYAYGKRDFRLMPAPAFEGQSAESNGKHYFSGGAGGSSFAVKQSDPVKREGIIEFFKAYASDWNIENYIQSSGCLLPFKYSISDELKQSVSPFAQNMIEILNDESSVFFSNYWMKKNCALNTVPDPWGSVTVGNKGTFGSHWVALNAQGVTLDDYKAGVLYDTYTAANWQEKTK